MHESGLKAFDAMELVEQNVSEDYVPANGASYPTTDFGDHMKIVAQMINSGANPGHSDALVSLIELATASNSSTIVLDYWGVFLGSMTRSANSLVGPRVVRYSPVSCVDRNSFVRDGNGSDAAPIV